MLRSACNELSSQATTYRIGRRMSVRGSSQFVREKALNDEETLGYGGATSRRSKGSTDNNKEFRIKVRNIKIL